MCLCSILFSPPVQVDHERIQIPKQEEKNRRGHERATKWMDGTAPSIILMQVQPFTQSATKFHDRDHNEGWARGSLSNDYLAQSHRGPGGGSGSAS